MTPSPAVRILGLVAVLLLSACPAPADKADGGQKTDAGKPDGGGGGAQVSVALRGFSFPLSSAVTGAWVVYQDGDAAWQPASAANGKYSFPVKDAGGRYGVAVKCVGAEVPTIQVVLATTAESTALQLTCPAQPAPTEAPAVVFATHGWQADTHKAAVMTGTGNYIFSTQADTFTDAFPEGLQDFAAVSETTIEGRWSHGILRHNDSVTGSGTKDFDFGSSTFAPIQFHLATQGVTAADTSNETEHALLTAHGSDLDFPVPAFAASMTLDGPPASVLLGTDRILVSSILGNGTGQRAETVVAAGEADVTLTPPPYLSSASLTVQTGGSELLPTAHWAGGPSGASVLVRFGQANVRGYWLLASAGRLHDATSLALPDLTAAPGFDPAMTLDPAAELAASIATITSTGLPTFVLSLFQSDPTDLVPGMRFGYAFTLVFHEP